MAAAETAQIPNDRADKTNRRRPFSTWMKKLANLKPGHSADATQSANGKEKKNSYQLKSTTKKNSISKNNNPYPESGHLNGKSAAPVDGHQSFSTVPTGSASMSSLGHTRNSARSSEDGHPPPTIGNKATTVGSTDVARSEAAPSHAASSGEGNTTVGVSSAHGADSTFSSPAPSLRSLSTTLTTIHSAAPNGTASNGTANNPHTIQFSHQFPTSPPPSALPAHLVPQGTSSGGHPATYSTATANNLLTDNASILTLASSSKRRRRRSMDTDASVRALAPSSLFGGSRESLPLSVLSATIDANSVPIAQHPRSAVGALNERASIYSATGVAPALTSERNSYYAGKQSILADGGSVKSGLLGHGRNDSISGSIGAMPPSSPLAANANANTNGKMSRTNSGWEENEPITQDEVMEKKA